MADKKIIGLCGSLRQDSFNKKLLLEAVRLYGKCNFTEANLRLPLYNGDDEKVEKPISVLNLHNDIKSADGVIITSPEYNKRISGVLKNSLDWVSRVPGSVWKDKPVVIMSAAAGRTGGEAAQYMGRACLTPFGPRILNSPIVCVAQVSQQFDSQGQIISERYIELVKETMENLRKAMN